MNVNRKMVLAAAILTVMPALGFWVGTNLRAQPTGGEFEPVTMVKGTKSMPRALRPPATAAWRALMAVSPDEGFDYTGFEVKPDGVVLEFHGGLEVYVTTEGGLAIEAITGPRLPIVDTLRKELVGRSLTPLAQTEDPHYEIADTRVVPNPEEPGEAAVMTRLFWTGSIPTWHGDVCRVSIRGADGQVVKERGGVHPHGPLFEDMRDVVVYMEMGDVPIDPGARPNLRCTPWNGVGYPGRGPATLNVEPPTPSAERPFGSRTAWVSARPEWQGPHYPSLWRCNAVVSGPDQETVADGTFIVHGPRIQAQEDAITKLGIHVPVDLTDEEREAAHRSAAHISCRPTHQLDPAAQRAGEGP